MCPDGSMTNHCGWECFDVEETSVCLFTKGRNAVVAVLDLALHEMHGPVALSGICARTGMTLSYLESIFRKLRSKGLVLTIRGSHGGFLLAQPAEDLTVADVMLAIDESIVPSINGGYFPLDGLRDCNDEAANLLWINLNRQLVEYLGTISIKDLIECQHKTHDENSYGKVMP